MQSGTLIGKGLCSMLAVLFLLTTSGLTWHYHYCSNVLIRVSMLHTPKPCCEHPEQCCRNSHSTLQLKTRFCGSPAAESPAPECLAMAPEFTDLQILPTQLIPPVILPSESPPETTCSRLARLQCYLI